MINILHNPVHAVRDEHGRHYFIYHIGTRYYAAAADVIDQLVPLPSRLGGFFWCGRWYTISNADCNSAAYWG